MISITSILFKNMELIPEHWAFEETKIISFNFSSKDVE